jgi:hypothetical protein
MSCLGLAPTAQVGVGSKVGVATDHATEISPPIVGVLLGLLRELAGPQEVVVRGEVRPSKSPVFASCHVLPTEMREKTVVGARNQSRSVLEHDAIGSFYSSPVVEYRSLDISAVTSDEDRSVDFISDT